jgi:hypothetical protein
MEPSWKELLYDEIHFKEIYDHKQLLEISYNYFERHCSVGNCVYWAMKISYYTGRVKEDKSFERYIQFTKDKQAVLSTIISAEEVSISQKLIKVGFNYPNLSKEDYLVINDLYSIDKYRDLLDDIFYDQDILSEKFKKTSEIPPSKIRNKNFSPQLIKDVFNGFISNFQLLEEGSGYYFYYDRSLNSVVRLSQNDVAKFVQFYIDFNYSHKDFFEIINSHLDSSLLKSLTEFLGIERNVNGVKYDIEFNNISWDQLNLFLDNNIIIDNIINALVEKWLKDLN